MNGPALRAPVRTTRCLLAAWIVTAIVPLAVGGDGKNGDGSDIPDNGKLCLGSWNFQFGPLTGDLPNTIMLDDTPGSKPPNQVTIVLPPSHYTSLAILYTGVAVSGAQCGRIAVDYGTGELEPLDCWEICDWVDPRPNRSKVVLQGCDWWRCDCGFVTGDERVSFYGQCFQVDPARPIRRVQCSVEGMGTNGDVGIFALSGCAPGEDARMEPIDLRRQFNFDAILQEADDDRSAGFRAEHKPQYFATEMASEAVKSEPASATQAGVAPMAEPSEIERTSPDFIVFDPTGGRRRSWEEIPLWNEHFLVQVTGDGNLLAFWTSTTEKVGYSRSEDGGVTWTSPKWFEEKAAWQVPVLAPSGRIYVLSTHGGFLGGLSCRTSEDHGRTWTLPVELPFPTTELDLTAAQWIACTVPHWDRLGRPLIAYTHWASSDAVPGGTVGITSRYSQVEIFRIDNLNEDPLPRELQIRWLNRDVPVTVPHETIAGASFAQEPYLVDLPDGRMMMTVRTNRGEAWYTVSDDQGERWRKTEPMRYRDDGEILQQPVAPAALFRLRRKDYVYLFNNNDGYVFGATSRWDVRNRRPAYISRGEFRPGAHQPIWWSPPKLFIDNGAVKWRLRLEAAAYTSLTEHQGRRVLWYPDRKGFLLGRHLTDHWLDDLKVPQAEATPYPLRR